MAGPSDRVGTTRNACWWRSPGTDLHPHFKHAGPRAMLGAGTFAGIVLQANRAFGPDHLTAGIIQKLKRNLPPDAKNGLKKLARHAPYWMTATIDAVTA